jgi:hypothetical protein
LYCRLVTPEDGALTPTDTVPCPSPPSAGHPSRERDLRIDLIRGLALFIIFIDHTGFVWLSDYTLQRFGFIDAAEVFIFLSGYVSGIAYTRVLLLQGFRSCQKKALRRCLQLYLAEVSLFLVCLLLVRSVARWNPNLPADILHCFRDAPLETAIRVLTMSSTVPLLGLLPVYIVFVGFTPLALYLLIRRPRLLMFLSIGSYVTTQLVSGLQTTPPPQAQTWFFNPFAWQIVFLGGLVLGYRRRSSPESLNSPSRAVFFAAALGLTLILCFKLAPSNMVARLLNTHALQDVIPRTIRFADKHNVEPLRIVNLLIWVIVVAAVCPATKLLHTRPARALILCGQNSLAVYWIGVVLSYLGILLIGTTAKGKVMELLWVLTGCACMVGTALAWVRLKPAFSTVRPAPLDRS